MIPALETLGFDVVGYGCMTCIGNSGPLEDNLVNVIEKNGLVCAGVLSGNRNFEGRIHPNTRANYLASPLLVIAYAIAGTVDIDFEKDPLGTRPDGSKVFLRDIWPTRQEIHVKLLTFSTYFPQKLNIQSQFSGCRAEICHPGDVPGSLWEN